MLQICVKSDTGITVEVYETVIECKTALLMATCARYGALLGGASGTAVQGLNDFGYYVGMAFQIQDDILDFTGSEAVLGKPVGGDLREGKVTLPVIYALEDAAREPREELLRIYQKAGPLSADEIRRATDIIEDAGGFERARTHALDYISRARRELQVVPESPYRDALLTLADHIVDRSR